MFASRFIGPVLAVLLIFPTLGGCGSPEAPPETQNNGVKPVPDYEALRQAEIERMEAKRKSTTLEEPAEETEEPVDDNANESDSSAK